MLANPERDWMTSRVVSVTRDEIEQRIGPTPEPFEVLGGGLANRNVRIGRDRVLRIYRDAESVGKEATLLSRSWTLFRTPRVLTRGPDFLLCEYVEHTPLSVAHGTAVGRALAEIHALTFTRSGFLRADLSVVRPADWIGELSARTYAHAVIEEAGAMFDPALAARVVATLASDPLAGVDAVDVPVLVHSDFKVSNVHWAGDRPLVLDWEYAWAGTRYMDIGQLLRWKPPEPFVRDFAAAYVESGGVLVDEWRRLAELVDLGSLIGLYRRPEARADVARRIDEIVAN